MRTASSPWAIASSCSVSSMSPTQWNFSGTFRSSPLTSSSRRLWLVRSQCRNSTALPTVAESSSVRTCSGSSPSDSSQTMPRSGSLKLWNSSITTALTWLKSNAAASVHSLSDKLFPFTHSLPHSTLPAVQQPVQEDFGHDDQHAGVGVFAAVAGHQAHVGRAGSPSLTAAVCISRNFCSRQGDQRRGVVGRGAGVQGLEQGRLGDQRLAGAGGRADQHALLGREPRQQRLLLHLVRLVGELVQVAAGKFVAGGRGRHDCRFAVAL